MGCHLVKEHESLVSSGMQVDMSAESLLAQVSSAHGQCPLAGTSLQAGTLAHRERASPLTPLQSEGSPAHDMDLFVRLIKMQWHGTFHIGNDAHLFLAIRSSQILQSIPLQQDCLAFTADTLPRSPVHYLHGQVAGSVLALHHKAATAELASGECSRSQGHFRVSASTPNAPA